MKSIIIKTFLLVVLVWNCNNSHAQQVNFMASYGVDVPGADLAERFGLNYNVGADIDYQFGNKWFVGAHVHMLLGPFVDEDVISNIRTQEGNLIGQQKNTSIITLKERGFLYGIHAGKFFNFSKASYQHGIRARLGTSLMSHYIIFNDESTTLNQLLGDYGRGYDRLTRGITSEQFIGYQYINESGTLNVYGGFQFIQGYTRNRRPVNFDTGITDHAWRLDLLSGVRVGIAIKLYEGGTAEDVFY